VWDAGTHREDLPTYREQSLVLEAVVRNLKSRISQERLSELMFQIVLDFPHPIFETPPTQSRSADHFLSRKQTQPTSKTKGTAANGTI
jgi:hypothetical protein